MATIEEGPTAECFRRALAGDTTAYRQFLTAIAPVMRGIVSSKLADRNAEAVEDVVQEILLAVHAKRHTWRREQPVLPWLYAIARHKAVDALRRGRHAGREVGLEQAEHVVGIDGQERMARAMDVERAVGLLEGRSRQVVHALAVEGASVAETGERLAISESAVRVAFHRGLAQLVRLRSSLAGSLGAERSER